MLLVPKLLSFPYAMGTLNSVGFSDIPETMKWFIPQNTDIKVYVLASSVSLIHAFIIKDTRVYDDHLNNHSEVFILTAKSPVYTMRCSCS